MKRKIGIAVAVMALAGVVAFFAVSTSQVQPGRSYDQVVTVGHYNYPLIAAQRKEQPPSVNPQRVGSDDPAAIKAGVAAFNAEQVKVAAQRKERPCAPNCDQFAYAANRLDQHFISTVNGPW